MRREISDFSFIIMRSEDSKDDYPLLANLLRLYKSSTHKPEIDERRFDKNYKDVKFLQRK